MVKQKDLKTQEISKSRKYLEEEGKVTSLPPGLINHGNTCFMNSVLQGLISTTLLSDLVQFAPLPPKPSIVTVPPIASRRSPQLTNQHGLGDRYEQKWVPGMPIGDVFVTLMQKAWAIQQSQRRESISPRDLLTFLGRKYDQYLDFAQQDAHEFLRQLLDAMRTEELDIIKQRQPPPPPDKQRRRRRRQTIKPPSSQTPAALALPPDPQGTTSSSPTPSPLPSPDLEDDKLVSFVDMIFGGKLTSILVCEKCKHISQTQEDFNDLSLSIRPDDYAKERKRGRFRMFARRITNLQNAALGVGIEKHRSSSVPPSPRHVTRLAGIDEPPIAVEPRRRSLDIMANADSKEVPVTSKGGTRDVSPERDATHSSGPLVGNGDATVAEMNRHVGFAEQSKVDKKGKKDKDDDSWVKFGRRISMSIRLGKDKEGKGRQRERTSVVDGLEPDRRQMKETEENTSFQSAPPATSTPSTDIRHDLVQSEIHDQVETNQASPEKSKIQAENETSNTKSISQPVSTAAAIPRLPAIHHITSKRPKSLQLPKPTPQETAYLRQILADITPSSSNPFALFRPSNQYGHNIAPSSSTSSAQALWLKMVPLPGIEECLRMFTAVEILDGENMVGCRRCWKIANGLYTPPPPCEGECIEDDSDSEENKGDEAELQQGLMGTQETSPVHGHPLSATTSPFTSRPSSMSNPVLSLFTHANLSDDVSISSLPTMDTSAFSLKTYSPSLVLKEDNTLPLISPEPYDSSPLVSLPTTPHEMPFSPPMTTDEAIESKNQSAVGDTGITSPETRLMTPIPFISTTAPESPTCTPSIMGPNTQDDVAQSSIVMTTSGDSLRTPRVSHKRPKESDFFDNTFESSEPDSDASTSTSVFDHSANSSPSLASPDLPPERPILHSKESSSTSSKVTRSKEVIMRAAYKRYLIGTPPPVLVIHLKRFQQISKTYLMSFSHGFKKLDDYVTFPEYLDLTPFLAPKKEDFGLGRKKLPRKVRTKDKELCMYRLYAVVVHIGHMLGGHYVAYTALPASAPAVKSANTPPSDSESAPTTLTTNDKSPRQWAYISDTVVRLATLEEVLKVKAYICMYERI